MSLRKYGIKHSRKADFIQLPFPVGGIRQFRNTRVNIQYLKARLGNPEVFRKFKQRFGNRIKEITNARSAMIKGVDHDIPIGYEGDMTPQTLTMGPFDIYKEKGADGSYEIVDHNRYLTKQVLGTPTKELGRMFIHAMEREYPKEYKHWAVQSGYDGNPVNPVPDTIIAEAILKKNRVRKFGKLIVRDINAPFIAQYGSMDWNTTQDGCYLDWAHIETGRPYNYLKEKLGDECDVEKLANFFTDEGHPIAFFGPDHRLQIKETRPVNSNHHKQLIAGVINNNHSYPIKNPELLKHIAHMKVGQYLFLARVPKFDGGENQTTIKQASLHPTIIKRFEEKREFPHALKIRAGNVVACQYGDERFYADPDVDMIKETLKRLQPNVPRAVRSQYTYRGQTPGSLAMDLLKDLRITNIQYRKSELSTYDPFESPHVLRAINACWNETMPTHAYDKKLCYTSCVYTRRHPWPVYRVPDDVEPFEPRYDDDGNLWLKCGRYNIKGSVVFLDHKGALIDIGNRWMDVQLAEDLINVGLLKQKQIVEQFIPSFTLPASYFIDLINFLEDCKVSKDFRKSAINRMIGSMGSMTQKTYNGYITNSDDMLLEGYNSVPISEKINVNYQIKEERLFQTHRPIWQAVIDMSYMEVYDLIKKTVGPDTVIHAIKTDAVFLSGVVPEVKIDKGYHPGHIHKEKLKQFRLRDYPEVPIEQYPGKREPIEFTFIKSTDLTPLLEEIKIGGSFLISGEPGVGKSYSVGEISKALTTYIATALSHKAVGRLKAIIDNAVVSAKLFSETASRKRIIRDLMVYDWVIVDEFSMVTKAVWSMISEAHQLGQKFIFAGDMEQLLSPEKNPINPLKHNFFPASKWFVLEYHDKCRCDPKLRAELQKLLHYHDTGEMPNFQVAKPGQHFNTRLAYYKKTVEYLNGKYDDPKRYIATENNQQVYNNELFEKKTEIVDGKEVTRYHSLDRPGRTVNSAKDLKVGYSYTIHKAQSATVKGDFAIHNVKNLTFRLLYTALSRGEKWENVFLTEPLTRIPKREKYNYRKLRSLGEDQNTGYVYALFDKNGKPIYVGSTIAKELDNRRDAHVKNHPDATFEVQYVVRFDDEEELRRQEYKLLRRIYSPTMINKVGTAELKAEAEKELAHNRMKRIVNLEIKKGEVPTIRQTQTEIIVGWKCPKTAKTQKKRFKIGKSIVNARKRAEEYIKNLKSV